MNMIQRATADKTTDGTTFKYSEQNESFIILIWIFTDDMADTIQVVTYHRLFSDSDGS